MDEHAVRRILEGGGGWPGRFLRAGLLLPGLGYGGAMALRRAAYRAGILASGSAPVPVLSVGNLTVGGTGKTPFTVMLARMLLELGRKPGILLRGYRSSAEGVSDEALLYRRLCPEAAVEVGADRLASAGRAVGKGADVLVLDDGFQHLRLRRNLDIVLVDATSPWGGGVPIPGGLMREPRSALRRAGVLVVTRSDQREIAFVAELRATLGRMVPGALILSARLRPSLLLRLDGKEMPPTELAGREVVALSGIARPEAFVRTLRDLGANVAGAVAGRDHGEFGPELLAEAKKMADKAKAAIVITEKDMGRKIFSESADNTVWVLGVEQEVDDPGALRELVRDVLAVPPRTE